MIESTNLLIDEKITNDTSITQDDKDRLNSNHDVLFIYKSNFRIKSLYISTQYEIPDSLYYLFHGLDMGSQWFSIEDSHFINEGSIFHSKSYINMNIRNTLFDMYKAKGGFHIDMSCLSPMIIPSTELIFDTIKFFFSQGNDSFNLLYKKLIYFDLHRKATVYRFERVTIRCTKSTKYFIF